MAFDILDSSRSLYSLACVTRVKTIIKPIILSEAVKILPHSEAGSEFDNTECLGMMLKVVLSVIELAFRI